MATKKPAARADQSRHSKALRSLREALGLNEDNWQAFLKYARQGFAEYEQANWLDPKSSLHLRDVPSEWFGALEPLGNVALRVLTESDADLRTPVADASCKSASPSPAVTAARRGSAWRG